MIQMVTHGRSVCHDGIRMVAKVVERYREMLLLLLICTIREVGRFNSREICDDILGDAI